PLRASPLAPLPNCCVRVLSRGGLLRLRRNSTRIFFFFEPIIRQMRAPSQPMRETRQPPIGSLCCTGNNVTILPAIFRFTSRDRKGAQTPLPYVRGSFIQRESTYLIAGTIALALAALGYILRFSVNAPVVAEWDLTHVLLGGMSLWDWS